MHTWKWVVASLLTRRWMDCELICDVRIFQELCDVTISPTSTDPGTVTGAPIALKRLVFRLLYPQDCKHKKAKTNSTSEEFWHQIKQNIKYLNKQLSKMHGDVSKQFSINTNWVFLHS